MGGRVDGAEATWPCCVEHARAESRANSCKSPRSPRLRQTTPKRRPRRTCHWFLERRLAVRLRQGYGGQPSRGLPTVAHGLVGKCERRLVRKRGFEPLRYCYRQPLKLVRLPVSPLPRVGPARAGRRPSSDDSERLTSDDYLGGAGGAGGVVFKGAVGVGAGAFGAPTGARGAAAPLTTEPGPRWPISASAIAPTMNSTAITAVAFDGTVGQARAHKADWLLTTPNAAPM